MCVDCGVSVWHWLVHCLVSGGGLCEQANKFQTDKRRRGHNSADRTGSKWPGLEKFTRLVGGL